MAQNAVLRPGPAILPSILAVGSYSIGSLNEPPSLNGPAAILSGKFNLVLLHFVYDYHFVVSTLE